MTSSDRQSVDIVMPFHRNDRFLVEAVSSIMSSNGVRIRLILIDDRKDDSSDLTFNVDKLEIVKSHGVGYSRALRLGLEMVKSKYFALLDSDDLSHKDRLARELDLMHRENLDIVACSMKKIGKSSVSKITQPLIFRDIGILRESNLLGSINSNSTWMCKTDLLNEQNFLSSKFISLDWATTLQLNPKTKVGFIDSRLYSYRQHESQMTKNIQYKNQAFFEIYPLWAELNEEFGLPSLSLREATSIAAPWSGSDALSDFPIKWIRHFLTLPQIQHSVDFGNFFALLGLRCLKDVKSRIRMWKQTD